MVKTAQATAPTLDDLPDEDLDLGAFDDGDTADEDDTAGVQYPDFNAMKKPELVAFAKTHEPPEGFDKLKKMKVKDLKTLLKARYGDPEALDSPAVTGMDPDDLLVQIQQEVEGIEDEDKATDLLRQLADDSNACRFRIGGVLSHMSAQGWTGGHEDFYLFVRAEFGFERRTAQRLIQTYHCLTSCGAPFSEARELGWTLILIVAPHLTPDNWREVFQGVAGMSCAAAEEWLKGFLAEDDDDDAPGEGSETNDPDEVVTLKFKLFSADMQEAVEAALKSAGKAGDKPTTDRGHQLYRMSLAFESGLAPPAATEEEGGYSITGLDTPGDVKANLVELFEAIVEDFGDSAGDQIEDVQDAIVEATGAVVPGDLDHWPDGLPEVSEPDFLRDVAETLESAGPAEALTKITQRMEELGEE